MKEASKSIIEEKKNINNEKFKNFTKNIIYLSIN